MTRPEASELVAEAEGRLWSPPGARALAYLIDRRGLAPETIRAARLGWAPSVRARTRKGRDYVARGVVIPWFAGDALALVKVRQPDAVMPKYSEVFRDRARHLGLYPGHEAICRSRPLVIAEGEFDALLLAQVLGELAAVVTLGSASEPPGPAVLRPLLPATPWYVATDADDAGESAAADWSAYARRVPPPKPYKDWTEAAASGVDLRPLWADVLAGIPTDLAGMRWGPSIADPEPGIVLRSQHVRSTYPGNK
jgi:hypothetical protein